MTRDQLCPCQSGKLSTECCQPHLISNKNAQTALALMRSRFVAYTTKNVSYLLKTWHSSTRPATINTATIPDWQKLEIICTNKGGEKDKKGSVEFKAYGVVNNTVQVLHEKSRFVKESGSWFYVDGIITATRSGSKTGRNEPCPCNSGKKYKKCCGP